MLPGNRARKDSSQANVGRLDTRDIIHEFFECGGPHGQVGWMDF